MRTYNVVVSDQVFPDVDIERAMLAEIDADLTVAEGSLEAVLPQLKTADAILNTYLPFDAATIAQLDNCKIIARYGIGIDNIDVAAAKDAGLVVTNVPDYCVEEVAVHTLTMMLSLIRRLPESDALIRQGGWGISTLRPITRFSEMTIGLVGYGRIAREVGKAILGLGASLLVFDPYVTPEMAPEVKLVPLEELLKNSDAVTLHPPLTDETRGMINAKSLALMPDHAILVNASRGPLIVFDDLAQALRDGTIRAAALDVFETEPFDPKTAEGVPNLLMSPHTAFYSDAAIKESQTKAATQVINVLTGKAPDYDVR